jgi:Uma2 family endonuclease
MQATQPITDKGWVQTFKPIKPVLKPKPLIITWNKLPPDFELPDAPVDNFAQPLLADALREALGHASLISPTQLIATNFGIVTTVNGEFAIKAPDWVYVPDVIPLPKGKDRKSYTPYEQGALPKVVMEFLSDNEGREYAQKSTPPYGKWFFYEQILKVPLYAIFNPDEGALEVYHLKSDRYQRQKTDKNGWYWIEALDLFLGVWHGMKQDSNRTGYWLRWWDTDGNLLLWGFEKNQQAEKAKMEALEKAQIAEDEKRAALEKADKAEREALETKTTTTLQIVKQMLQANAEIAFIMQVTGLDKASIENLSFKTLSNAND